MKYSNVGQVFSQATGAMILASFGAFGKHIEQRKGDGGCQGTAAGICLKAKMLSSASDTSYSGQVLKGSKMSHRKERENSAKKKFLAIRLRIPQYQTFPDLHLTPAWYCRGRTAQLLSQPSSLSPPFTPLSLPSPASALARSVFLCFLGGAELWCPEY